MKDRQKYTFDGFLREVRIHPSIRLITVMILFVYQRITTSSQVYSSNILRSPSKSRTSHSKVGIGESPIFKVRFSTVHRPYSIPNFPYKTGQELAFLVSNKTSFELPLSKVANSNIAGRTEVSLEFATDDSKKPSKGAPDEMVEIRFHVPGTHTKASRKRGSDAGSKKSDAEDEEDEEEDDDDEETSAAQVFHDAIKDKADIGQVTGDIILSFEEVLISTPRGRYDVDMFPEFLRLRGKTYDYKILYSSISRLFLLPKDDMHVLFIVSFGIYLHFQFCSLFYVRCSSVSAPPSGKARHGINTSSCSSLVKKRQPLN